MAASRPLPLLPLLLLLFLVSAVASYEPLIEIGRGGGGGGDEVYCDSWRLSVETNNAGAWRAIPGSCVGFVAEYVNGQRYASDLSVVAFHSIAFAQKVDVGGGGGKDAWVFDVDETLLSNLPYYALNGYGSEGFNETSFDEWVSVGRAPALPASLTLYEELRGMGFLMVLLTGRSEAQRAATEENLLFAGYHSWERLILREPSDIGKTALVYKSERRAKLEAQGFRIHGCSGDQWSDLLGQPMATRVFKLPNPMYYIA